MKLIEFNGEGTKRVMKRLSDSVLGNSSFWGGVLGGVLVVLLVLGGGSVVAQGAGDARPGGGTPADVPIAGPADPERAAAGDSMLAGGEPATLGATAAIGSAFTYQGVLSNAAEPATGTYDFRFRLLDAPAAGTQLGEVFADSVPVQNGQFTVQLDFGTDAFSKEAVWLEIAVRPAGAGTYETLSPRQAITAMPLALGLPNVFTNPATGRVSIGGGTPLSSFEVFGIKQDIENWVGMYIAGGGPNARPFYGYATSDTAPFSYAWTEYNGTVNEWQLHTASGKVFSVSQEGNVSQPATANGLVKAAAVVECWDTAGFLSVVRSFNTITNTPVTAAQGSQVGQCFVDFGFDLRGRYFSATAQQASAIRGATCAVDTDPNRLNCVRWRVTVNGAEGWGGVIHILVY
jgi:hypothetical protein